MIPPRAVPVERLGELVDPCVVPEVRHRDRPGEARDL